MTTYLQKLVEEKGFLIAAHRGTFKANIIENTIGSFKGAIMEGADIVEIDLIRSTDGVLYLFHDGAEGRVFNKDINIFELSSKEIDELVFYNQLVTPIDVKVTRLVDYLDFLKTVKRDFVINIDRCFDYFDELLPILDQYDLAERILIKAPVVKEVEKLADHNIKYPFMGIVKTEKDVETLESIEGLNLVALELIVTKEGDYFDNVEVIKELKEKGYLIWLNSITLHDEAPLFHRFDDNTVIHSMSYDVWDELMKYSPDIIQTDWIAILSKYRKI